MKNIDSLTALLHQDNMPWTLSFLKNVSCCLFPFSVATAADIELRKMQGVVNWNNVAIVNKLYSLFKGTVVIKGQVKTHIPGMWFLCFFAPPPIFMIFC